MENNGKVYVAIDLKSFYASVECVDRGFDPLNTNLTVADPTRTEKTICLAVSPSLKAVGVGGRCRLFELIQAVSKINAQRKWKAPNRQFVGKSIFADELASNSALELDYIVAPPQMARYEEISSKIYSIYLRHIAPEDIHVYSIDEVFIDATDYLKQTKMNAHDFTMMLIQEVLKETGITATAGIGTNMFLCKVAMDIEAKKMKADKDGVRIAWLTEKRYREKLWDHTPITDFWRVGAGYAKTLAEHGMFTMGDVALCSEQNEDLLYKLFGVNAELLIDHAWGYEPTTIAHIKSYKPSTNSISSGQVLTCPYDYTKTKTIINEMAELLSFDLLEKGIVTNQIVLDVGYDVDNEGYEGEYKIDRYGRKIPKHAHGTENLERYTSSTKIIIEAALRLFDRIVNKSLNVRRLNITACKVMREADAIHQEQNSFRQMSLFDDPTAEQEQNLELQKERKGQETILQIRQRFGKNAILRGVNFQEGATAIERNGQIGGHRATQAKKMEVRLCTQEDMNAAYALRHAVFVEEQNVDEALERDTKDNIATHTICFFNGKPIGTGRLFIEDGKAHIGRVCVLKDYRNKGAGKRICNLLIGIARKQKCKYVELDAQEQAEGFYLKLGFVPIGEPFVEAGIRHIQMVRKIE